MLLYEISLGIKFLFNSYRFSEISRLIDISTESVRDMVCKKLEDDNLEKRIQFWEDRIKSEDIIVEVSVFISFCDNTDNLPFSSFHFFDT